MRASCALSLAAVAQTFLPSHLSKKWLEQPAFARGGKQNLLPPIADFGQNPYAQAAIKRLTALIETEKTAPFVGLKRTSSIVDVATAGGDTLELIRAYCYSDSPLKVSADCLKSIIDRCDCLFPYAQNVHNEEDFVYLPQLSEIILMLSELMAAEVGKARLEHWTGILEALLTGLATKHTQHLVLADLPRAWAMADVRIVAALAYGGMVFPRSRFKTLGLGGLRLMDKVLEPDGGVNYSDEQNDCFAYHPVYVTTLARLWQITGEKMASELVAATQWYLPVSTGAYGASEYYTGPCWKQLWNLSDGADAAAVVVGITGSAYNAAHLSHCEAPSSLFLASFYRADVKAQEMPSSYIFYDQNIKGPRGRNGNFSFAATGRAMTNSNRGHASFVGCLVAQDPASAPAEARRFLIDAALAGAGMEVTTSPRVDYMQPVPDDLIYLAQRETVVVTTTEKAAALSAHHRLAAFRRSASEWFVSQAWLMTPERLVGLVDIRALSDQLGCEIKGALRFVSGASDWGTAKKFVPRDGEDDAYDYGALAARIIEHDFASLSFAYTNTFNDESRKSGRLVLGTKATGTRMYPLGTGHFYVAEIRASQFAPAAKIKRITEIPGVIGLDVEEANGRVYKLVVNDTSGAITLGAGFNDIKGATVHDSGETFRLPMLPPLAEKSDKPFGKLAELASLANLMDPDGRDAKNALEGDDKASDPYLLRPYRHKLIVG